MDSAMWFWLITVLGIVATIVAFKVNIKLDLNQVLKNRQINKLAKLQNCCPHMEFVERDGKIAMKSLFVSPPNSYQSRCQNCKQIIDHFDKAGFYQKARYYEKNPKIFQKQIKAYRKRLKKMKQI